MNDEHIDSVTTALFRTILESGTQTLSRAFFNVLDSLNENYPIGCLETDLEVARDYLLESGLIRPVRNQGYRCHPHLISYEANI